MSFAFLFLKTGHNLAILKSFMNCLLVKDKLNTWLRAPKIWYGKDFNTLVGTRSIPALVCFSFLVKS